jgi:lysophospholipase L1-like esterase
VTYPPSPLSTSFADGTATPSTHPGSHNLLGAAINDTVDVLGTTPQGTYSTVEDYENAVAEGASELNQRKLFGWKRALYERDRVRAVILAGPGDSRTEGSGIDSINDRWLNILARALDDAYPTEGYRFTEGYIPAWYSLTPAPSEEPVGAGNYTNASTCGLGMRCTTLKADIGSGVGQKTFTVQGDNAFFCYARYGNSGKSEYNIDGGAFVEIDHNVAFFGFLLSNRIEVSLGGTGSHTIIWRFKSTGSGAVPDPVIEGIEAFEGSADIGISVLDCAHGGGAPSTYANFPDQMEQWPALVGAQLSIIDLGTNNWNVSDPSTIAADLAAYESGMTTVLERLADGNPDIEIELCGGWTPRFSLGTADPAEWPLFVNIQYQLANTTPNVSLFDYRRFLPEPDAPGDTVDVTGGFYTVSAIHPEEAGHAAIGSALTDHLSLKPGAWAPPEPGLAVLDLTDSIIDLAAGSVALGTDGECLLYYKVEDGFVSGWLFLAIDDDATFPNSGVPFAVDAAALPAVPATAPSNPFGGGVYAWTGSFGFATDTGPTFTFPAIPSVISGGNMAFVIGLDTAGGLASLWSDTTPHALGAVQTTFQCGVRYPTETSPAAGS